MMMRLLKILPLGLLLACRTAYASTQFVNGPDVVSDSVITWGIAIFLIIIGMFIALIVVDARKNGRYK